MRATLILDYILRESRLRYRLSLYENHHAANISPVDSKNRKKSVSSFTEPTNRNRMVISPRNVDENPDSPQAIVFLTSIVDVAVGSLNVLHTLPCRLRLEYICLT